MRTEHLRESAEKVLELTEHQATALAAAGRRLASRKAWWGADDDEPTADRTVVWVQPRRPGHWAVRVSDAVGVLSVGDLQLVVEPKIPMSHLLYLFEKSGGLPRLDEQQASIETAGSLWRLVAAWCVRELERLLRRDLMCDYLDEFDELPAARGRMEVIATSRLYYAGRPVVACEYEEFGFDTPLNRVLKAAAGAVAASPLLEAELRRRAIRVISRMDEVGVLKPSDTRASLDRRTGHYATAHSLARHVLEGQGRAIEGGNTLAWSFLIRTPEMVEEGLRRALAERLGPGVVTKEGRAATGSKLTFTPDLVFPGCDAVGDVKYKLATGEWTRSDLYQAVTFAEAFGVGRAVIVPFATPGIPTMPDVTVGSKVIHEITWPADEGLLPAQAADTVAKSAAEWLGLAVGTELGSAA